MKFTTKVVTGEVRFNYVNTKEARVNDLDSEPKFGITILIPKESSETMGKIYIGMANATKNGLNIWGGQVPEDLITCLKDGDLLDRPEYQNHFYINTNSKQQPQVVDRELKEITDSDEVYNGCYGRVSINFYPYNHIESGNCGIAAGLLNIQKIRDGEKISNRSSAADDFDIIADDGILI
ncbi:MAG: DUF2815 family protein [Paraclostridium sp.]|uniref:DUF2815 family protein n=1 Tax=Paraclostridium sp. TaxID=2023273 RepID=UPI003F304456